MSLAPFQGDHTYMSQFIETMQETIKGLEDLMDVLDLSDKHIALGADMAEAHGGIEQGECGEDHDDKVLMHFRMLEQQAETLLGYIVTHMKDDLGIIVKS